jgi:hypothetical protein
LGTPEECPGGSLIHSKEDLMSDNYPTLPKVGDIVTWEDTIAGHGTIDGKVVSIEKEGVFVSQPRYSMDNGVKYSLVPYVRIIRVRTPKETT